MPWHAMLTGGWVLAENQPVSDDARDNILMMNSVMNEIGMTLESQAGLIGNVEWESALNPWRWGYDQPGELDDDTTGYGLFQYTPPNKYINSENESLPGYSPNLTPLYETPGATPDDGHAQMLFFDQYITTYGWVDYCWRPGWTEQIEAAGDDVSYYWNERQRCVDVWGNGSGVSYEQFKECTDINDATFIFLACFEGPLHPMQYDGRVGSANVAYEIISGDTPPYNPTGRARKGMPLWMYLRRY